MTKRCSITSTQNCQSHELDSLFGGELFEAAENYLATKKADDSHLVEENNIENNILILKNGGRIRLKN